MAKVSSLVIRRHFAAPAVLLLSHTPITRFYFCAGSGRGTHFVWMHPQMVDRSAVSEWRHSDPPRMHQLEQDSRRSLPSERIVRTESGTIKSALTLRERRY